MRVLLMITAGVLVSGCTSTNVKDVGFRAVYPDNFPKKQRGWPTDPVCMPSDPYCHANYPYGRAPYGPKPLTDVYKMYQDADKYFKDPKVPNY